MTVPEDFASNGAGGVFDQSQASAGRDLAEGEEIAGHSHLMHTQDRPRFLGNGQLDQLRIEIVRQRIDIGKDWNRPAVSYGAGSRNKGITSGDDLIAGPDTGRQQR